MTEMKRYRNILFVADLADNDAYAFAEAVELANQNEAKLTVVASLHDLYRSQAIGLIGHDSVKEKADERHENLTRMINKAYAGDVEIKLFHGRFAIDIIREVIEFKRDLVIKPVDVSESIAEMFFGSVDLRLIRKSPCPVWLIKPNSEEQKNILLCLDYEPDNEENIELNNELIAMATALAISKDMTLHIINSYRMNLEKLIHSTGLDLSEHQFKKFVQNAKNKRNRWLQIVNQSCEKIAQEQQVLDLKVVNHLKSGDARNVIPQVVSELKPYLVVMGSLGRTGISGYLMGNTAEAIINKINHSVLTVKPKGFVSPITVS